MDNIYLVGFMGTGKTTVGEILSRKLKREFVETDRIIEKKEGLGIPAIFSIKGEAYFRKVEKEVLKDIASKDNLVVSCGGGIVIDKYNITLLRKTGIMVCLKARPSVIYERTKSYKHRPLLNVKNPMERIKELLQERERFYKKAHIFIDTSDIPPQKVAEEITHRLKCIKSH